MFSCKEFPGLQGWLCVGLEWEGFGSVVFIILRSQGFVGWFDLHA